MLRRPIRPDQPARKQVAARVREMIRSRSLRCGDVLPSYAEIGQVLDVSYVTVKRGMDVLESEGVIHRVPFHGTFVTKELAQVPRQLGHVGVIFPSTRELLFRFQYLGEIMRGVTQDAPAGSDMHIFSLREDGMVSAAQLGEWNVSGVILLGVENDDYLRAFAQWGTPGIVVDYCSQAAPLDYVACDNRSAARQVVAHLSALGHRHVAYAASHPHKLVRRPDDHQTALMIRDSSDIRERLTGTLCALRESGLSAEDWTTPEMQPNWAGAAAEQLLRRARAPVRPTALVTESNYTAFTLLEELARRGLRVPGDVSVCAVASDGDTTFGGRRLTCCRFDFLGMGRQAIRLLAARCEQPEMNAPRAHRIAFEFVEGQTTEVATA